MKILFIVSAYPRWPGDVITPWMGETIARLRERNIEVEVLAPAYRGLADQEVHGVKVHRFRYAPASVETLTHDQTAPDRIRQRPAYLALVPSYIFSGSLAASRLARSGRFDVIHAFWPLPHGVLGLVAKRWSSLPLVVTFFGVELTWMERQLPFLAPVLRRIVRRSDAVTAISSYTADRLRRQVTGASPVIIPFGGAVQAPSDVPPGRENRDAPFDLLFVGRLVERKGIHLLLKALSRIAPGRPLVLHIVGDGPERARLEEQARSLQLAERVVFHGFVAPDELESRLASCDCFVLPAVVDSKGDTEGLGVVLLEAMSYGKPTIASAAGGIVDIVRDGRNGWLVPPGDDAALAAAITDCMDDPVEARAMGLRGRKDVEADFSWNVIADRLEEVYRRVLDR